MESPFFSSHWSNFQPHPRYSPIVTEVPVHRLVARTSASPKVVSIPVHFVGTGRSRSDSALMIQKVFRGFLVRKSMKKIVAIREEVNAVEKAMSRRETVESIRRDAKERLRMNETLMSLLFRLDSVRAVNSGVRDCRKAVIRKAIALQERIDAIVVGDQGIGSADESSGVANGESSSESADQAAETKDSGAFYGGDDESKAEDGALESEPKDSEVDPSAELCTDCSNFSKVELDQTLEREDPAIVFAEDSNLDLQNHHEPMLNSTMVEEEATDESPNLVQTDEVAVEDEEKVEESAMAENKQTVVENMDEGVGMSSRDSESSQSGSSANRSIGGDKAKEEEENGIQIVQKPERNEGNDTENGSHQRRSSELWERMMEDNEKMMGLMADLFERNHSQMQLLSSLTQRVEQLERALMCEKLRKKKKKRTAVDCSGRCPNVNKKYGNR